jgi:hypothetical protein
MTHHYQYQSPEVVVRDILPGTVCVVLKSQMEEKQYQFNPQLIDRDTEKRQDLHTHHGTRLLEVDFNHLLWLCILL